MARPRSSAHSTYSIAVAERERQFLRRRRSGFADVIAADRNRIEARRMLRGELDRIRHQPHRRTRRKDVFLLRDVFLENVVLQGARELRPIDALLLGHRQVHRPQDRGGRIDGHRDGDVAQRNAAKQNLHILERADRGAALAHLAFRQRVIGVVAHQRRQIEGDRESGLALFQQVMIAAVGLLRRGEAGELAHGPELAAIHVAVDAARVREIAGRFWLESRQILGPVDGPDGHAADRSELARRGKRLVRRHSDFIVQWRAAMRACVAILTNLYSASTLNSQPVAPALYHL